MTRARPVPVDLFLDDAQRRLDRRQLVRQAMTLGISLPALSALLERTSAHQATPAATTWSGGPPVAERRPEIREFSGVEIEDPYAWLRQKPDPEVIRHLKAENAYPRRTCRPPPDCSKGCTPRCGGESRRPNLGAVPGADRRLALLFAHQEGSSTRSSAEHGSWTPAEQVSARHNRLAEKVCECFNIAHRV